MTMNKNLIALSVLSALSSTAFALDNYDLLSQQATAKHQHRSFVSDKPTGVKSSPLVDNSRQTYIHPVLGTPQFFWASEQVQPFQARQARNKSREQLNHAAGAYYLDAYRQVLSQGSDRLQLSLESVHQQAADKPVFVRYLQKVNGIPVLGAGTNLLMDKNRQLISVSATLAPVNNQQLRKSAKTQAEFSLSHEQAINLALQQLAQGQASSGQITETEQSGQYKLTGEINGWQSAGLTYIEKLYYPQKSHLIPAYRVSLRLTKTGQSTRHYGVIVSADNGRLLQRKNYSRELQHQQNSFQYRVFADTTNGMPQDGPNGNNGSPHPTGKPDGFQAEVVEANLISISNAGKQIKDPWLAADATVTTGNNVDAYLDLKAPDGFSEGDFRARVKEGKSLDHPFDGTKDANLNDAQKSGAVTNLFYAINYLHDVYYEAGFDEKAGNAQKDNYGRGGADNDHILAEGQDFSGINNANMNTPPDGQNPIMQQYLFISNPALTVNSQGLTQENLGLSGSLLGQRNYNLESTALVWAKTADDSANICQDITNADALKDKIAIVTVGSDCDASKLNTALEKLAAKAVIIVGQDTQLPSFLERAVSYPVLTSLAGETEIAEIKKGTVSVAVSQKADFIRDSTVSNMVVLHEWGHYLHERLAGNGQGLGFNVFAGALGEGYGDFNALLHQVREEDLNKAGGAEYKGTYAQGGWVDGSSVSDNNQAYYFGIRRVPYSIDPAKNALSYRHLKPGETLPDHPLNNGGSNKVQGISSHAGGEIWASVLFDAFIALAKDTPRLNLEEARSRMRQYLVGGLKLTPSNPTFLMARDGILATAFANDKQDAKLILQAFAKRGMGTGAGSPATDSTDLASGLVESSSTSATAAATSMQFDSLTKKCDSDNIWDEGETASFKLKIRNGGLDNLSAGKLLLTSDDDISAGEINFPEIAAMSSVDASVAVTLNKASGVAKPVTLKLASEQTPEVKAEFVFNSNYDLGASNQENFENGADGSADFTSLSVEHLKQNPDNDSWARRITAGNYKAIIYPYVADLDEALMTTEFKVSASDDFSFQFKHAYLTREQEAGGLLEIKEAGKGWVAIEGAAVQQLDAQGQVKTQGYGSSIKQGASTDVDGRDAFTGTNQSEGLQSLEAIEVQTIKVNLAKAYAGKTVQVRWRFVSAPMEGEANDLWVVDELAFSGIDGGVFANGIVANGQSCSTQPPANKAPTVTLEGAGGTYKDGVLTAETDAGKEVKLKAKAQDADGDNLTYNWEQSSGTAMQLKDKDKATLTVTVPANAKAEELGFKLTVADGKTTTAASVKLKVKAKATTPAPTPTTPAAPAKKSSGGSVWYLLGLALLGLRRKW